MEKTPSNHDGQDNVSYGMEQERSSFTEAPRNADISEQDVEVNSNIDHEMETMEVLQADAYMDMASHYDTIDDSALVENENLESECHEDADDGNSSSIYSEINESALQMFVEDKLFSDTEGTNKPNKIKAMASDEAKDSGLYENYLYAKVDKSKGKKMNNHLVMITL